MTSRIPQRRARTIAQRLDLKSLQKSLQELDAPPISTDDLTRLYQGPMGELLSFILEHVRGRSPCAVARDEIYRYILKWKWCNAS
jgi:hypothetical protein